MKSTVRTSFATALAGALMVLSTASAAQGSSAVKLSEAELDQITAGSVISGVLIFNRGEGPGEAKMNRNHTTCINCVDPEGLIVPRTSGVVTVVTPSGKIVSHPIRQAPFSF